MKNSNNRFIKLFNKIDALVIFILLALLSVIIDGTIIYGVNNSSLVSQENQINEIKKEAGSYLHIRYGLESFSEASRLSLINPINEYNGYRTKELGRNVSYALNKEYEVSYKEISFKSSYIVFEDFYSNSFTINNFRIANGSYKDIELDNTVYLSSAFLKSITGLSAKEAIGKEIKLSIDKDKTFIIGGIIDQSKADESGIHFNKLFDPSFILMNRKHIYEYGYTDLLFASTELYYLDDSLDFINTYNKSYLKYDEARMRVSSYKEEQYKLTPVFSPKTNNDNDSNAYSFLSILVLAICYLLFVFTLVIYDFKSRKWYKTIPIALILFSYHFLSVLYVVNKMKAGLFMSRLSIILFIIFLITSLILYIHSFIFFDYENKKKEKEQNNG